MSAQAEHHTPHDEDPAYAEHSHHPDYVKIWGILVGLLVISVIGPMFGIKTVTLITAFGIAVVKAYLVAKNFMHIDIAPRYVVYLVTTMLVFMLLFFAGTAPDVMNLRGTRWEKPAWIEANEREATLHPGGAHGAHGAPVVHGGAQH